MTSSGERVLGTKSGWALNRGQITLIFLYRGKFILSLNRGVTKSGVTKSGSDCSCILGVHVQDFQTTFQEPTEPSKQPIRTSYLVHVTGYQPIRDQYFIIRSIPATFTIKTINEREEKFSGKATRK